MLPTNGFGNRKRGGWLGIDPLETARSRVERPDVGRDCGRLAEKHSGYPVRRPHLAELAEAFPYSEKPVATPGRNEHRSGTRCPSFSKISKAIVLKPSTP